MAGDATTVRSPGELAAALESTGYLADEGLATVAFLALRMGRPLFCEGEPGTGKTSLAAALAQALDLPMVRLQCHEGIDASQALYDWDFPRQLLHLRTLEAASGGELDADAAERSLYTERYLLVRPLLRALTESPCVLLVDEIDRADDEFEALLLEFLGEFAVTVPELGTLTAVRPPVVVLTSNRSRDLHDALRRRCLYHWIDYPDRARAVAILRRTVPSANGALVERAADFVAVARGLDLDKAPGIAESIDWVSALAALGVADLARPEACASLAALAKTPDDRETLTDALTRFVAVETS